MRDIHDCFDCHNAAAAARLIAAEVHGARVTRDSSSSGHSYKHELIEVFGWASTIDDARKMWPRNRAAPVSELYLANEVYLYVTSSSHPPIFAYWPWERVSDYYASRHGVERTYGYGFSEEHRPDPLDRLVEQLRMHPTTKRAVVSFYGPEWTGLQSGDTPCTLSTQYRVVDGALCSATTFRSHDYFGGFRTDPLRISFVQQFLVAALATMDVDLDVGSLTQFDGSLHYYPNKKHGDLRPIAEWRHPDDPPYTWELFTAGYVYYDDVRRELQNYLSVVRFGDRDLARALRCPNLRAHAERVCNAIDRARAEYGSPPTLTGPVEA